FLERHDRFRVADEGEVRVQNERNAAARHHLLAVVAQRRGRASLARGPAGRLSLERGLAPTSVWPVGSRAVAVEGTGTRRPDQSPAESAVLPSWRTVTQRTVVSCDGAAGGVDAWFDVTRQTNWPVAVRRPTSTR